MVWRRLRFRIVLSAIAEFLRQIRSLMLFTGIEGEGGEDEREEAFHKRAEARQPAAPCQSKSLRITHHDSCTVPWASRG